MLFLRKLSRFTLSNHIHVVDFDHDQDMNQEFYQNLKLLMSLVLLQFEQRHCFTCLSAHCF